MSYTDKAIQYAKDIVDEKIVSGKYIKLQCQKFLNDLDKKDWTWRYSIKRANHICGFMENGIKHTKGPLAGKLLKLEPWQCFILCNIYGWIDDKNIRRYQYAILQVGRKNGKTLFASGLAIYEMLYGEAGGEVYSLATKMDQAKLAFEGAEQMIHKAVKPVKDQFKIVTNQITNTNRWSFYKPLGRDSKSLDGLNPTLCIYDEAAAYSDRNIVEVMTSATGARDNFLHLFITTAQFSRTTVYYENRIYLTNILEGRVKNDRWFGMLYEIDKDDDWADENIWIKANPNIDVSLKREFLREEVEQAKTMQSKRNGILVKHFNVFTNAEENWLNLEYWQNCRSPIIREGELFIGMDLASRNDLTALCYLWNNGDKFSVDFQCFLPRKAMEKVPTHLRPLYDKAIEDGLLHLNPGDTTDYQPVFQCIEQHAAKYDLKMVGYDRHNANWLVNEMEDKDIPHIDIGQGMTALTAAAKETERMIIEKLIRQSGHPFIDWQLECCSVYEDKNENIKITKDDADKSLKIDSIIAMIMALSMAAGKLDKPKEFDFEVFEF